LRGGEQKWKGRGEDGKDGWRGKREERREGKGESEKVISETGAEAVGCVSPFFYVSLSS